MTIFSRTGLGVWHFGDGVGENFVGDAFESGGWKGSDHSVFGEV
jgi:hypothetical protein